MGIGDCDFWLRFLVVTFGWNWGLGLGIGVGDWVWELGLGIGIGDWDGVEIEDWDC